MSISLWDQVKFLTMESVRIEEGLQAAMITGAMSRDDIKLLEADMKRDLNNAVRCMNGNLHHLVIMDVINHYKNSLPSDINDRLGKCYELAGRFALNNHYMMGANNGRLVHGTIKKEGIWIEHAWIHIGKLVYDPVFGIVEPIDLFNNKYKRKPTWMYTIDEVHNYFHVTQSWAPWRPVPGL